MNIILEKTAVEAVRDALAALIENEKQAQEKLAAAQAAPDTADKDREAATKLAEYMLETGMITGKFKDEMAEKLSSVQTALPQLKKAIDLYRSTKAETKTAQADGEAAPRALGRKSANKHASTKEDPMAEANARFEQALGL